MKKLFLLLVLAISATTYAFNREGGGRPGASAVYIEFRSFGSGVDEYTKSHVMQLIGEAGMRNEVVDQTSESKGREGESIECVQLSDATKRHYFIKAIAGEILTDAKQFNDNQRTIVYVGTSCRKLEEATEQDLKSYLK